MLKIPEKGLASQKFEECPIAGDSPVDAALQGSLKTVHAGLLINFHEEKLVDGVHRIINR